MQYTLLEYEIREISEQLTTRVYKLDAHLHDMQQNAVVSHMGALQLSLPCTPFHSNLFYCRSCDTVANSCARPRTRANRRTQSHIMSVKTVVDDDNGILLCAQNNKHSNNHQANIRTITFDNCLSTVRCRQQQLLILPISGKLVQVKHGIYCLCVACGRVTKLSADMQLKCHMCKAQQSEVHTRCFMCHKASTQIQRILCFSIHSHNLFKTTELCQACVLHVCKQTRFTRTRETAHTELITRKQLTRIQQRLVCRRQLAIPGERFDFFQATHRRKCANTPNK